MGSLVEMCGGAAPDAPLPLLQSLITNLEDHNAFNTQNKEEIQILTSGITNLLGQGKVRIRGLILLKGLLDSGASQQDIIVNHGHVWLPLCIKSLRPSEVPPQEKRLAFLVISKLLERASKIHELEKSIVISSLSDIIDNIEKSPPALHNSALLCLESLLLGYSKPCGGYKTQIERFLVQFLDHPDSRYVIYAAKCAHLLQQVRGGGEQGVNHKFSWKNQLALLICSANDLIKEIYSISKDETSYENMSYFVASNSESVVVQTNNNFENTPFYITMKNICSELQLQEVLKRINDEDNEKSSDLSATNKKILHICKLNTRLKNILTFIQAMLVEPFSVAKSIKCSEILEVLLRCLAMKCKLSNQKQTLEMTTITSQVPSLYITVMKTLEALIISIRGNILPYVTLLLKMILQVLETTKMENYCGGPKPYKNVRIAAYNALRCLFLYVSTLRPPPQEGENGFEDRLINNLLDDISYYKPSFQLTIKDTGPLKNMSKKARNKLNMSQLVASNLPQNKTDNASNLSSQFSPIENLELMESALSCLESFFRASGMFLKENSHKRVHETVLKQVYSKSTEKCFTEALLKSLSVIRSYQSSRQPSIISYCLEAFSKNQNSSKTELKTLCQNELHNCMSSIRGCVPPLELPLVRPADFSDRALFTLLSNESNASDSNNRSNQVVIDVDSCIGKPPDNTSSSPVKRKPEQNVNSVTNNKEVDSKKRKKVTTLEILDSSSDDDCTILEPSNANKISSLENQANELSHEKTTENTDMIDVSDLPMVYVSERLINDVAHSSIENIVYEIRQECGDEKSPVLTESQECLNDIFNNKQSEENNVKNTDVKIDEISSNDNISDKNVAEKNLAKVENQSDSAGGRSSVTLEEMMDAFVDEVNEDVQ